MKSQNSVEIPRQKQPYLTYYPSILNFFLQLHNISVSLIFTGAVSSQSQISLLCITNQQNSRMKCLNNAHLPLSGSPPPEHPPLAASPTTYCCKYFHFYSSFQVVFSTNIGQPHTVVFCLELKVCP